jgi:hypothetical protein
MTVVDINTIAYLYLPIPYTESVEKLLAYDGQWAAPQLWRSEFRKSTSHKKTGKLPAPDSEFDQSKTYL